MSKPNGTRAMALAQQFKQQTARVIEEKYRVEVKLPIPSIAPDFVFEFVAQRVDVTSLLYNGQLPETFAKQILGARREARSEDEITQEFLDDATAAEKQAALDFQIKIAQEVCYAPKLVFREPVNDEEIDVRTLPFSGNLIIALFNYAMGLSPDVPVGLTDGTTTTVEAVSNFPDGAQGPQSARAGADGAQLRRQPKRIA
jgi:hypothetical protein